MIKYYAVNGKICLIENAKIQINDLGLLRGYGIFDFLKFFEGVPLFIEDHLTRFRNSANYMGLSCQWSNQELHELVLSLIEKNDIPSGDVKNVLTGGYSEDGYLPAENTNLLIVLSSLSTPSDDQYINGVNLMFHEYVRDLAQIKTTNYIVPIQLAEKIKENQAFDVLYHMDGNISESSRSNFFIVTDENVILTPKENVLFGVTRKRILQLASQHYHVIEGNITLNDLKNAREAFISSTLKAVMPVVRVDDLVIGSGRPGPICQHLNQLLTTQINQYIQSVQSSKLS